MLRGRILLLLAVLIALPAGCAYPPPNADPTWPYPQIRFETAPPAELAGTTIFEGRWMETMPGGTQVLAESSLPRYLLVQAIEALPGRRYLDLGPGAEVENVTFDVRGERMLLTAAISNPHVRETPIIARSVLEVDLRDRLLVDTAPLPRDAMNHGMAVDPARARLFLLEDEGGGRGVVRAVDRYQGSVAARRTVGNVPAGVTRRGLAMSSDGRELYCLTGGEIARNDFDPVDADPTPPAVLVLDADSLVVTGEIPLSDRLETRALGYDESREHLVVLLGGYNRSAVVIIDAGFRKVRSVIDLPEDTTDLVLVAGTAFLPGAHGIYIVDLVSESWISRPTIGFEQTGEIAVAGDRRTALVRFSAQRDGSAAGVAVVDLSTGAVREIWQ